MSYRDVRKRMVADADSADPEKMPCVTCNTPMPIPTLSDCGARCYPCLVAYCREAMVMQPRSDYANRVRAEIQAKGLRLPL